MECGLPHLSLEVLSFSSFPQGMEWIALPLIMISQDGIWAESSSNTPCFGLAELVMHCRPSIASLSAVWKMSLHLVVFFLQKKLIFV